MTKLIRANQATKFLAVGVALSSLMMWGCGSAHNNQTTLNANNKNSSIIAGVEVQADDPISKSIVLLVAVEVNPETQEREEGVCTGSIIADDIVLTAAHCIPSEGGELYAVFGRDGRKAETVIPVSGVVVNANYKSHEERDENWGDIAVVRLAEKIPANYHAVSILEDIDVLEQNISVVLAGYGKSIVKPELNLEKNAEAAAPTPDEAIDDGTGLLRKTTVKLLEPNFGETEVVLDQREGTGACNGDSGGPAYVLVDGELKLFGVTSRGNTNCDTFAIYTNVLAHTEFVNQSIAKLSETAQ